MAHSSSQSPTSSTPVVQSRPQFPHYQPPTTSEGTTREHERISTILQINAELLQHISKLQGEGYGGQIGSSQSGEQLSQTSKQPSQEYVQCMRALQSNIAFCVAIGDRGRPRQGHSYPGPVIMHPPAKTSNLVELYQKMQALFPDWKGVQGAVQRQQQQQQHAAQERARHQMQQFQQQQQQAQATQAQTAQGAASATIGTGIETTGQQLG